jgi:hypothetical protein
VWRVPITNNGRFMYRSYTFPDRLGRNLVIHERLEESPYPFIVARSILQGSLAFRRAHSEWLQMRIRRLHVQLKTRPPPNDQMASLIQSGIMVDPEQLDLEMIKKLQRAVHCFALFVRS